MSRAKSIYIDDIISFGEWAKINNVRPTTQTTWRVTYPEFPKPIYKFGPVTVYDKRALDRFYVDHWWLGMSKQQVAKYLRSLR